MFCVSETEAAAIRAAYEQGGEFSVGPKIPLVVREGTDAGMS
jgi:hypothetical protein